MFKWFKIGYLKAYICAAKAGWIANGCKTGCVIDDETETIYACFIHEAELSKLEEVNKRYFNK